MKRAELAVRLASVGTDGTELLNTFSTDAITAPVTEIAAASPVEQSIEIELVAELEISNPIIVLKFAGDVGRKYLRGEGADLKVLRDRKPKGELAVREELHGKSAKAAAKG
ncbi:hypothetical protein ACLOJK_005783 [Asimina triloba]